MGFDKIIQSMANDSLSPLEEINYRIEKNVNDINESKPAHGVEG
jgi:hypothetical protein